MEIFVKADSDFKDILSGDFLTCFDQFPCRTCIAYSFGLTSLSHLRASGYDIFWPNSQVLFGTEIKRNVSKTDFKLFIKWVLAYGPDIGLIQSSASVFYSSMQKYTGCFNGLQIGYALWLIENPMIRMKVCLW